MIHYTCDYCGYLVSTDLLCMRCQSLQDRATKPLHVQIEQLRAERDALREQLLEIAEREQPPKTWRTR